jgi:electron transport complex protein RnfE
VTNGLKAALTMSVAVGAFVLLCANVIISLIRNLLKPHLRIVIFTLTIATFVTIVDRVLAAYMYQMSKTLGPYIPLIIVNCIIICRCEVCASRQGAFTAAADALGQSLGFGLALTSIAACGNCWAPAHWPESISCPPDGRTGSIMVLPPGAFLTFGLLLALVNWYRCARKGNRG